MSLRESLPARVALTTAGLLVLVMLIIAGAAYTVTALSLRQAVDATLATALDAVSGGRQAAVREAERLDEEESDHRRLQILDGTGQVQYGPASLPVDPLAVAKAQREGYVYQSLVQHDDRWLLRTDPDWWQALTPQSHEMRVIYARGGTAAEPLVLQMAAPLGEAGHVLPELLRWLIALGAGGTALAVLIAWLMARELYRPLGAITATASDVSTQTLSLRVPDLWHDRTLRRLIGVLNAMIARLQAAFDAQGRFVAAAAHELRGPLGAMKAELEVALRRQRSPEEYREALEGALAETNRLSGVAEHLLMLARYERGAAFAMEENLPLAPLLERTAEEVRRSAGGEVLVEAPADLVADGDPLALERAVTNLARNAVQAGGSPVTVTAEGRPDGVWLHVADHGPGIPREALPHIFEPFYRADPARGRDGGTGLGLAIVKTVVEAHRGRVEVESSPGVGTTFHVWLPRHQREIRPAPGRT
jgi:signal transduction histidine kinase